MDWHDPMETAAWERPEDDDRDEPFRPIPALSHIRTDRNHTLYTLTREAHDLIVGLSIGAYHPTRGSGRC